MNRVVVNGKVFEKYIAKEKIQEKIISLGNELNDIYRSCIEPPLLLGILNGSFIFMADLIRRFEFQCTVQFIRIESYQGMESSGLIKMEKEVSAKWKDRDIIVIEDIVDTGRTMNQFVPLLRSYQPKSVRVCCLLFKEDALEKEVQLDHYCFKIPKEFVVGYGLDYDGLGRNLEDIYKVVDE